MNEYPEHEKADKVRKESQSIGEFLEWLNYNKGVVLCTVREGRFEDAYMPMHYSIEDLLAQFFEIDLAKIEQENRDILDAIRKSRDE